MVEYRFSRLRCIGLRGSVFGNRAGLPELRKHVTAQKFDFLSVGGGGGFDLFSAVIAEEAQADGDNVALVLVALKKDLVVSLADPGLRVLEPDVILFGFEESGNSEGGFSEVIGGEVFT